jgi:hypothetical protein
MFSGAKTASRGCRRDAIRSYDGSLVGVVSDGLDMATGI